MNAKTKKLTMLAMLAACAYIVMVLVRIPVVLFLKYEAKDVVIVIGGFLFGPLSAFLISLVVSLVEMVTVSDTGIIGMIMNVLSTCSFACVASAIYKKKHTMTGAIIGLISGVVTMCVVMLLWNYLITPLYMNVPRTEVIKLLIPAFLPFNLIKGGLNTAFTLLLYKPLVRALRKTGMIESHASTTASGKKAGIILLALALLATCIFFLLVLSGVL